eukprot:snap_masked-scaffold_65-processed-gene-0.44-mRNA-1 protein AED:1.00 eAED:1.00 QI:0/-1/0/0/-1/1/1/0/109
MDEEKTEFQLIEASFEKTRSDIMKNISVPGSEVENTVSEIKNIQYGKRSPKRLMGQYREASQHERLRISDNKDFKNRFQATRRRKSSYESVFESKNSYIKRWYSFTPHE